MHSLRGVRDRLGQGEFVLHVSLRDVLQGGELVFQTARGSGDACAGNTPPVYNVGKYYVPDLMFGQSVRLVCPAACSLRSHVVLLLELWALRSGKYAPVDAPAAYGVFPLVDRRFAVVSGHFKTPLLRGRYADDGYDTHREVLDAAVGDLSKWAGNLYFSISADTVEAAAEAADLGGGTVAAGGLPDQAAEAEAGVQPCASAPASTAPPSAGTASTAPAGLLKAGVSTGSLQSILRRTAKNPSQSSLLSASRGSSPSYNQRGATNRRATFAVDRTQLAAGGCEVPPGPDRKLHLSKAAPRAAALALRTPVLPAAAFYDDLAPTGAGSEAAADAADEAGRAHLTQLLCAKQAACRDVRLIHSTAALPLREKAEEDEAFDSDGGDSSSSGGGSSRRLLLDSNVCIDAGEAAHDARILRFEGLAEGCARRGSRAVWLGGARQAGQLSGRHTAFKKLRRVSLAVRGACAAAAVGSAGAKEDLFGGVPRGEFTYALPNRRAFLGRPRSVAEKLPFVASVLCFDTGVNPSGVWDTPRVLSTLVLFVLALHLVRYAHALGVWLVLNHKGVFYNVEAWYPPVLRYENGQDSGFTPVWQVATMAAGPAFCLAIQFVLTVVVTVVQAAFGYVPYSVGRMVFWVSVSVALDPLLTAAFDGIVWGSGWAEGSEAASLYTLFERENHIGLMGLAVTAVVYLQLFIVSGLLLYKYTVHCYLGGRVHDVYMRCSTPERGFTLPHDAEVSRGELQAIVHEAAAWRSDRGEVRRVVCEEAVDAELCLFRERLWVLLSLAEDEDGGGGCGGSSSSARGSDAAFFLAYLHSITLRRPKHARTRDGLGTARVGRDILALLRAAFPFLMRTGGYAGAGGEGDGEPHVEAYYDRDFLEMQRTVTGEAADASELRHLVYRFAMESLRRRRRRGAQGGGGPAPVRRAQSGASQGAAGCDGGDGGGGDDVFEVCDAQLLADVLFFETHGAGARRELLARYLGFADRDSCTNAAQRPLLCSLPGFSLQRGRFASCAVHAVRAGFVTVYLQRPGESESRRVHRAFVLCPTGEVVEAVPTVTLFDPAEHTTDHPEYWIHRLTEKHATEGAASRSAPSQARQA